MKVRTLAEATVLIVYIHNSTFGDGVVAQLVEHRTVTPLTQVRFPGAARDFLLRVIFQCRLSFGVRTFPRAIVCFNICAYDKDPVVCVRVRWIMAIHIPSTTP